MNGFFIYLSSVQVVCHFNIFLTKKRCYALGKVCFLYPKGPKVPLLVHFLLLSKVLIAYAR